MEAREVTRDELEHMFPPPDILEQWHQGKEADWPPSMIPDDEEEMGPPNLPLRFTVGTAVECRIGPNEWARGQVIQLYYREPNWAPGSYAPYKILLQDGRNIFAPADMDQVIRQVTPSTTVAP
jgi:hypothetical protein